MFAKSHIAARIFLGLIYTVFGLNGFLNFIPMPPLPESAGQFLGALAASGYFFPVLKISEIIGGILLLANKFSALALLVLAPITLQIVLFHAFLTPGIQNLVLPAFMLVTGIWAAMGMKDRFSGVLKP